MVAINQEILKNSPRIPQSLFSWFIVLFIPAVLLRLILVFTIPEDQSIRFRLQGMNDEPSHYNYVQYLVLHHTLPIQTMTISDPRAFKINEFEYYQPPTYYLLCEPLPAIAGKEQGLYFCRLFSFVTGIATLLLLALIFKRLGVPTPVRYGGVLFAAYLPTHMYFSALVSNDSLCWFFSALLTLQVIDLLPVENISGRGFWTRSVQIGLTLAAAMLTKSSTAIFFPIVAMIYTWIAIRKKAYVFLLQGGLAMMISLAFIAPWYVRNLRLYGEIFAMRMGFGNPNPALHSLWSLSPLAGATIRFFWFPMQHVPMRTLPVTILDCIGILLVMAHGTASVIWCRQTGEISPRLIMVLGTLCFACAAYIMLSLTWSDSEARFLFPAFSAIVWIFSIPLATLQSRLRNHAAILLWPVAVASSPWLYLFFVNK